KGVIYQDIACFGATTFPVRVHLAASSPALPPLFSGVAGPVLPKNRSACKGLIFCSFLSAPFWDQGRITCSAPQFNKKSLFPQVNRPKQRHVRIGLGPQAASQSLTHTESGRARNAAKWRHFAH